MTGDRPPLPEAEWTPWQREQLADWRRRFIRDRHEHRMREWKERQRREHAWVAFAEIADWCSRERGSVRRDPVLRAEAWHDLVSSVLSGEFARAGRCCVAYLPGGATDSSKPLRLRLNVEDLRRAWDLSTGPTPFMLPDCWAPVALFAGWFKAREIIPPQWLKAAAVVAGEPPAVEGEPATKAPPPTAASGRRGPKPVVRERVAAAMLTDLRTGKLSSNPHDEKLARLQVVYGASADTCRKAYAIALSKFQTPTNCKQR